MKDGNCGYLAVACLMSLPENDWRKCRNVLLMKLNEHLDLYKNVSSEKGGAEQLHHRLTYFDDFSAPKYTWMTMPNMGHLIASTYNVMLVFLSQRQYLTFLLLLSRSLAKQPKVNAIGFVNGNHFIRCIYEATVAYATGSQQLVQILAR
ncbi:hypothetical protein Vadar_007958 [Vaccinium darrowii]|uniref:Uncharacterized protein n=1 Tax=Vaccinium darrowii TaxID=229202 RepID=A0ACB7Z4T7_9ERIC|nr:hypothetical protein Vadar_007958 [Vaccinium darrowii]